MNQQYVVFYPDGLVTIEEHEGTKNKWPVGTIISMLWSKTEISSPRTKHTGTLWITGHYKDITPVHRTMMLLLGIRFPAYLTIDDFN